MGNSILSRYQNSLCNTELNNTKTERQFIELTQETLDLLSKLNIITRSIIITMIDVDINKVVQACVYYLKCSNLELDYLICPCEFWHEYNYDIDDKSSHIGMPIFDTLNQVKAHYVLISDYSKIDSKITDAFKKDGLYITGIAQIINTASYIRYKYKLQEIAKTTHCRTSNLINNSNEHIAFHASKNNNIESISLDGLNIKYASNGLFGKGIYSSPSPKKANCYFRQVNNTITINGIPLKPHLNAGGVPLRYMFALRVCLGNVYNTKSDRTLLKPPTGYDSVSGHVSVGQEYIVYNNDQVYVTHIIFYNESGMPSPVSITTPSITNPIKRAPATTTHMIPAVTKPITVTQTTIPRVSTNAVDTTTCKEQTYSGFTVNGTGGYYSYVYVNDKCNKSPIESPVILLISANKIDIRLDWLLNNRGFIVNGTGGYYSYGNNCMTDPNLDKVATNTQTKRVLCWKNIYIICKRTVLFTSFVFGIITITALCNNIYSTPLHTQHVF